MKEIRLDERFGYGVTNEVLNAAGFFKVNEGGISSASEQERI